MANVIDVEQVTKQLDDCEKWLPFEDSHFIDKEWLVSELRAAVNVLAAIEKMVPKNRRHLVPPNEIRTVLAGKPVY